MRVIAFGIQICCKTRQCGGQWSLWLHLILFRLKNGGWNRSGPNQNILLEMVKRERLCGEARFISSYEAVGCKSLESALFFFREACCLSHSPGCSSLRFSGLNDTVGCLFSLTWL